MTINETASSVDLSALAGAMVDVHKNLPNVPKDAINAFSKSRYASLTTVIEACRKTLTDHGIWIAQYPVPAEPGYLGLVTKLVHAKSGQWQSALMVMPLGKADPQGYGSALTYARRYGLATLVGLATEADDDGVAATVTPTNKNARNRNGSHNGNGNGTPEWTNLSSEILATLPQIDGVEYQAVKAPNGRTCITASGNAREKRTFLEQAGFRWDGNRRLWWRYAT